MGGKRKMKIEIWSDFVCPFCYMGKRRFEEALRQFEHRDAIEVVFRSFELDPNSRRDVSINLVDHLAEKYNITKAAAKANIENITMQAKMMGLEYHLEEAIQANTFDAHRVSHYAKTLNLMDEITERLMQAHFTEGLNIGDHDVLMTLSEEAGLNGEEVQKVLIQGQFGEEVRRDQQRARELGIRSVPNFLIDGRISVSGAQPIRVFLQALEEAWGK